MKIPMRPVQFDSVLSKLGYIQQFLPTVEVQATPMTLTPEQPSNSPVFEGQHLQERHLPLK